MSIYFVILFFLLTVYTRNLFHCEGELLRVRLIIKNLPTFNFFIQEVNKYWEYTQCSTRKIFYEQYVLFEVAVCWLIRRKARVRVPGQTSKRSTKSISSAISSQQISGKNSESNFNCHEKFLQKSIVRSRL